MLRVDKILKPPHPQIPDGDPVLVGIFLNHVIINIYIYMGSVRFPGPPDLGVW